MKKRTAILILTAINLAVHAQVCVTITQTNRVDNNTATFNFTLTPNGVSTVTDYTIYLLPTRGSVGATMIALQSGANTLTLPFNMGSSTINLAVGATTVDFEFVTVLGEASLVLNNTDIIPVTLCNPSVTLPVEWIDFSGKNTAGGNLLTWTTANEVNNKGFQIERSMENGQWTILGFVNAQCRDKACLASTTTPTLTYHFTDSSPLSISYYRLRQIDNDGRETLSKTISITRKAANGLKVYPNPVSNILNLQYESPLQGLREKYQVINLLGQTVLSGKVTTEINVSTLPPSTYFLKIGTVQVKFVKQ